jgi:glutamate synthase (NADPH/NADH) small chain
MEKRHLDRRIAQMQAEGTMFRVNTEVGVDISSAQLHADFDAVVLAGGATQGRDLPIPGRDLEGILQAMDYLPGANRVQEGDLVEPPHTAEGKDVIIIGGGDTGADCLGTSHRQGARSVHQFEIMPRPPEDRRDADPWPTYPNVYRVSSAHEEGGDRVFAVNTTEFVGSEGKVTGLRCVGVEQKFADGRMSFDPIPGTEREYPAQLILLAMGFVGPERSPLLKDLGVEMTDRGTVDRNRTWRTNVPNVFVCGDMGRGQSLIVWAIAEGRACASAVDRALMGSTLLPAPLEPTAHQLR